MKQKAIFITNKLYVDKSLNEGGVSFCTKEYIELIAQKFDLIIFPIAFRNSLWYRILVKLGLNNYQDYHNPKYRDELKSTILTHEVKHVFLNQCNTASLGIDIKKNIDKGVSIYLCSHGNESGDLLHEYTRFSKVQPIYKKLFSNYIMGRTIRTEVFQRLNFIDGVLTVSEVETQIENWLGAKKVMFVPRTLNYNPILYNNSIGTVGFIGDLSHPPNYFGLKSVFDALNRMDKNDNFQFRLVGSGSFWGEKLATEFPFVSYLGYLSNEELTNECESWSFFINPVFYYSRGVSTKLAKALGMGLPVITSSIGKRGYSWSAGKLPEAENPTEMAEAMLNLSFDLELINNYRNEVKLIARSSPNIRDLGNQLSVFLEL